MFGATKAVLLALEGHVGYRDLLLAYRHDHECCLVGRNDLVFQQDCTPPLDRASLHGASLHLASRVRSSRSSAQRAEAWCARTGLLSLIADAQVLLWADSLGGDRIEKNFFTPFSPIAKVDLCCPSHPSCFHHPLTCCLNSSLAPVRPCF